jgi:leucine dehydrogenase
MIESLIAQWDGEMVVVHKDKPTGAVIIIAVHSSHLGPATGGTRMKPYESLAAAVEDAFRLSAGMTYKFAVPGMRRGGGKAVIVLPGPLESEERTDLLRRYGTLIHRLGGLYYTGPDVGTSADDMDIIAETGRPYVFCCTAGGAGSSGPYTALGVYTAIQAAYEHVSGRDSLAGCRVLVQGVGSVGRDLIDHLLAAEATVLFSEIDADVIGRYRDEMGLQFVPPDQVPVTECDVYAPCALGGVLNGQTIPRLRCRAVAGGANNQLAGPDNARELMARGILYAPDFVVNVGGAMGLTGIELEGWTAAEARGRVSASVRRALQSIFHCSEEEGITTHDAACRIAEANLGLRERPVVAPAG